MKIKIKETGDIKIAADYARIQVEDCDSYGTPLEYTLDEIELLQPAESRIDWTKFKANAIVEIAKSIISSEIVIKELCKGADIYTSKLIAGFASEVVDELMKQLKAN